MVLVVLGVVLVVLEVVLVVVLVVEVEGKFLFCDNYKDYTYVGTLDSLYQHTLIATGTRLRPLEATFLGHILGTKPAKHISV